MLTDWTKHTRDEEEKVNFERLLQNSRTVLNRLNALLDERESAMDKLELSVKSFDNPNWAYRQAFNNGFRSCLGITKTLINLDQGK